MVLFDRRTLFELTPSEVARRYAIRILVALLIIALPVTYAYFGMTGILLLVIFSIIEVVTRLLKKRSSASKHAVFELSTPKGFVFFAITTVTSRVVSGVLVLVSVLGLIISAFAYPISLVSEHFGLHHIRHSSGRNSTTKS